MLRWIDLEHDWSAFRLVLPIAAAVMTLAALLVFVWRFDPASSPTWQLVLHHLMLVLFLSTTFVLAAQPRFCLGEGFRWAMLVLAVLLPAVVFSVSWVMNGVYDGVRDERFFRPRDGVGGIVHAPMGGGCLPPGGLCLRQGVVPGAAGSLFLIFK